MENTPSEHSLRFGLPGYLIPFATQTFVPDRQTYHSELPSLSVFLPISTDFTPPLEILLTSNSLELHSIHSLSNVEHWFLKVDLCNRLRTLYAQ